MKKFLLKFSIVLMLLSLTGLAFANIECSFRASGSSCGYNETAILYANKFMVASGLPHNAHVSVASGNLYYDMPLCCKSSYGNITSSTIAASGTCSENMVDFLYFTPFSGGSHIGFDDSSIDSNDAYNFNVNYFSNKICVKLPVGFGSINIVASEKNYGVLGYSCLYKTNNLTNSHVSSCSGTPSYKYTVWGKMAESTNTLRCDSNCVSILTGRVNYFCSSKIEICKNVEIMCDGALLDSWVSYNSTHDVRCSSPWNVYRPKTISDSSLMVSSVDGACDNIVVKQYPVILNNEHVLLKIYICED